MLNNSIFALYLSAAAAFGVFSAYTSSYWAATRFWGLKLVYSRAVIADLLDRPSSNPLLKNLPPEGYQTGITSRTLRLQSQIRQALNPLFLGAGIVLFNWYVPVAVLFGVFLLKNGIRSFLPANNTARYRRKIVADLKGDARRFEQTGKAEKLDAARFFIRHLEQLPD